MKASSLLWAESGCFAAAGHRLGRWVTLDFRKQKQDNVILIITTVQVIRDMSTAETIILHLVHFSAAY